MLRPGRPQGRERILEMARRRFEQFGFRRTSVADIARDAGVAPATIYSHFENKEDLFLQVIEAENASWLATAREVLSEPAPAIERFAQLAAASVRFNQQSKLLLAVLRRDGDIVFAPLIDQIHERLLEQNVSLMAEVIQQGIDEGSLRPVDPERAAYILFATGHALFNQSDHAYQDLAPVLADLMMNGLARRTE